jgi:hypothetical protein
MPGCRLSLNVPAHQPRESSQQSQRGLQRSHRRGRGAAGAEAEARRGPQAETGRPPETDPGRGHAPGHAAGVPPDPAPEATLGPDQGTGVSGAAVVTGATAHAPGTGTQDTGHLPGAAITPLLRLPVADVSHPRVAYTSSALVLTSLSMTGIWSASSLSMVA